MTTLYIGKDFDCFEKLHGWMITEAFYDNVSIYLLLRNGTTVQLEPGGECCAHCYIQHVDGAEVLKNGVIFEVESTSSNRSVVGSGDVVDAWGHRIHTDKGICSIEMRVEHNGYYGGQLEIRTVESYAGEILEDF